MPSCQRSRGRLFGAALTLLGAGLLAGVPASAQNLDAGKSAAQLFTENCTACHRSPQGLAKGRNAASLAGFLRQHYTTGREPASQLAGYLASVGGAAQAAPPRRQPPGAERQRSESGAQTKLPAAATAPAANRTASAPAPAPAAPPPRRPRRPGELASVSSDPEPVTMSDRPVPVVHHRASSQAQEAREPPMPPARAAATRPTATAAKPGQNGAAQEQAGRGDAQPPVAAKPIAAEPQPFDGPLP